MEVTGTNMENTHKHAITGIILKDEKIYVPLEEVAKLCKRFPTVSAIQLSEVIEKSIKELTADPEKLALLPKFTTDTSKQ